MNVVQLVYFWLVSVSVGLQPAVRLIRYSQCEAFLLCHNKHL